MSTIVSQGNLAHYSIIPHLTSHQKVCSLWPDTRSPGLRVRVQFTISPYCLPPFLLALTVNDMYTYRILLSSLGATKYQTRINMNMRAGGVEAERAIPGLSEYPEIPSKSGLGN